MYFSSPGAYIFNSPANTTNRLEVRDLLVGAPPRCRSPLGVRRPRGPVWLPGQRRDAVPAFDNCGFAKYDAVGPGIVGRDIDWSSRTASRAGTAIRSCTHRQRQRTWRSAWTWRGHPAERIPGGASPVTRSSPTSCAQAGCDGGLGSIHMEFVLDANPCFATRACGRGIAALAAGTSLRGRVELRRGHARPTSTAGTCGEAAVNDIGGGPIRQPVLLRPAGRCATMAAAYQSAEPVLFFPGDRLRYYFTAPASTPARRRRFRRTPPGSTAA